MRLNYGAAKRSSSLYLSSLLAGSAAVVVLLFVSTAYAIPSCDKRMKGRDGPGGFLWKESDHGGLVVLFPGKFQDKFKRVVVTKAGKRLNKLNFSGFANPDSTGERQHWRKRRKSINRFPKRSVTVRAVDKKLVRCWKVKRPQERND